MFNCILLLSVYVTVLFLSLVDCHNTASCRRAGTIFQRGQGQKSPVRHNRGIIFWPQSQILGGQLTPWPGLPAPLASCRCWLSERIFWVSVMAVTLRNPTCWWTVRTAMRSNAWLPPSLFRLLVGVALNVEFPDKGLLGTALHTQLWVWQQKTAFLRCWHK